MLHPKKFKSSQNLH